MCGMLLGFGFEGFDLLMEAPLPFDFDVARSFSLPAKTFTSLPCDLAIGTT